MKKLLLILLLFLFLIPVTAFGIEKGEDFALVNIYEIMEFAGYFIFVYLMILAKVFENRNITKNQMIE